MFQSVSANVFLFSDTCNVYVIRSGSEAVLIDFGRGAVLDNLAALGIERITDVLMTHHHRDQGQGLDRALKAGARIWVPHAEQDLFKAVDEHWQARNIYDNYTVRQDRFSLLEPVSISGTLHDYSSYNFGAYQYTVIPTPGHTVGSISLISEVDGQKVIFSGDLIAGPGKVWSLAATQWTYNAAEGVLASILSLLDLIERNPDMLLPSHGDLIDRPAEAMRLLIDRFYQLLEARREKDLIGRQPDLQRLLLNDSPYMAITSHLLMNRTSVANSYVLLSDSGKALIIDYGYDLSIGLASGVDRASRRPWLYSLPKLRRDFGVSKIDVVLPTHFHDDHVAGMNLLREVEGTRVWAAENFADILERPNKYDLPCLWYDPIPVDRVLPLHEAFPWEEYTLQLHPLPGHVLYAVAIEFAVDGKHVLATGDQYHGVGGDIYNYVYENRFRIEDYRLSAELYNRLKPDLIISGHSAPVWVQPEYLERLTEDGNRLEQLHRDLLPDSSPKSRSSVASIQPYQIVAETGTQFKLEAIIRNPFDRDCNAHVQTVVPHGWSASPTSWNGSLASLAECILSFEITPPQDVKVYRARVAVDVTLGDERFGQQAEALISLG